MNLTQREQLGNFILDSLPQTEYDRLHPHLQPVELRQHEIVLGMGEAIAQVYFPTTALVSWIGLTSAGEAIEVGTTGFEGFIGTPLILDRHEATWQVQGAIAGTAYQLSAEVFVHSLQTCNVLRQKAVAFTYLKLVQLHQSVICYHFHPVEQRLCRWLLAARDRVKTSELLLTREILSHTIGSSRPAVTLVTGVLQASGLIRAERGKVTILKPEEMEEASCECYRAIKREFDRYLG